MRLLRPLPLISTAVSCRSDASRRILSILAITMLAVVVSAASPPAASAQGEDFNVTIPSIELETTETGTLVVLLEPAGATVGALSLTMDMTDAVFLAATESLVSGVCDEVDGQVRFSGFSTTGWTEPVELCRITVRGAQVPRVGTPTITITVAANLETAPLTGSVNAGTITVGGAAPPVAAVTPTPTAEPTAEPTPEPVEDPTPEPVAEATPVPDTAAEEPDSEEPVSAEPSSEEPAAEDPATEDPATADPATADADPDASDDASTDTGRGDRAEATDVTPQDPSDDAPADSGDVADSDPVDDTTDDESPLETSDTVETSDTSETASPVTIPPLPAESSNRSLLVGLITAALFAVGALLALGARRASRDAAALD